MAQRPSESQTPQDATRTNRNDETGVEMIRSEEQLVVGRRVQVSGRAVLRKYVVTETVTQTFEVRHEEVRVEYEPDAGSDVEPGAHRVPFSSGPVVEMVLHREVPRVAMEVVAVERVRMHIDTVTEQLQVSEELRKEQLDLDAAGRPPRDVI